MGLFGVDPTDDRRSDFDAQYNSSAPEKIAVTQETAQRVGEIYRQAPYIPANVILSLAKTGASPDAVNTVAQLSAQQMVKKNNPNKKENKSWFQRNVVDKAKSASRWTFATLNLVPEIAQNVAAQVFSPNDPAGFDGWFASTSLGTLMSDSSRAGDGFFIGEQAAEKQAERARRVRGTINGRAWTVGRGAASLYFAPGSKPYNLLSGFVDAAVNVAADPTMYAGKALKTARASANAIPAIDDAEVLQVARRLARNEAGLTSTESALFEQSKFNQWALKSKRAQRLTSRIATIAADETLDVATKQFRILEAFEYNMDPDIARVFAEAKTDEAVRAVLGEASARLSGGRDVLLPTDIREIPGADRFNRWADTSTERVPFARFVRNGRWFSQMPKGSVVINGTGLDRAESIKTYANYMRGIGWGDDSAQFKELMPKVVEAFSEADSAAARPLVNNVYELVFEKALVEATGVRGNASVASSKIRQRMARAGINTVSDPKFEQVVTSVLGETGASASDAARIARRIRRRMGSRVLNDDTEPLFRDEIQNALVKVGGFDKAAKNVVNLAREKLAESRAFSIGQTGLPDDGGFMQSILQYAPEGWLANSGIPPDKWGDLTLMGPGLLSELADDVQILPDFRAMRKLTSNTFVARATKNDAVEGVQAVIEFVQNDIWKPLTLATGGYWMRNSMDAQVRIAMSGLSGFFTHPIDYVQWVMSKKGLGDIKGQQFDVELAQIAGRWDDELKEFGEAVTFGNYRHMEDATAAKERLLTTGNFYLANRQTDAVAHTTGYVDNLGLLAADSLTRQWAAYSSLPIAERQRLLLEWLDSVDGGSAGKTLRNYFRQGLKFTDPVTGEIATMPINPDNVDDALQQWVEKLVSARVSNITNGDQDLNIVVSARRVPKMTVNRDGVTTVVGKEILDDNQFAQTVNLGDVVPLDEGEGVVTRVFREATDDVDPFTGQPLGSRTMYEIQPVYDGPAFQGSVGSPELRRLIDMKAELRDADGAMTVLSDTVKIAGRGATEKSPVLAQRALTAKNRATDFVFHNLIGALTTKLERSPVFRQFYYRNVAENVDLLEPSQARNMLEGLVARAEDAGVSVENYVGGKKVLAAITKQADATASKAFGTIDELDQYAKMVALRQTKKLLYNATEKNNLEDILRVVVPFGSAWKEVLGTYINAMVEDPTRIRKAQLLFQGGKNFDPDADGQGFFYRDPTSGEYSFNFPMSGDIAELLTGINAPLQAPVKRLSIGLGVIPSIGPVAQIAASQIIPDTPTFDNVVSILLPYGRKKGIDFAPTWLTRMKQAWEGNAGETETIYANTYIETVRVLAASGEYDLADPNEQNKLYSDARTKARILAGMRAFGQFIGPTSPAGEFTVSTKEGDMYGSMLVKEFQRLQSENYGTSVQRFLEIFGDNAMIYLSNKTESLVGGLEATDQFADWERENDTLLTQYKNTAAYMAPTGDDFSFEAWSRQLRKGRRRRLTDREVVAAAQNRVGAALYREMRNKLPANPSDEQRAWLKQWRVELNRRYPGFPANAEFNPGLFPNTILELKQLVQEPSLQNNEVAQATAEYLNARDEALNRATESGYSSLKSNAAEPLRDWLTDYGRYLSSRTPEFARIWDRLLSYEVEE